MTITSAAARLSALAASRPPKPAPMITTLGLTDDTACSSCAAIVSVGSCRAGCQARVEALAIRATNFCEVRRMATHSLLLLPGDGIGPEVMAEVKRIIDFFNKKGPDRFNTEEAPVGGCCYDAHKVAITDTTMEKAKAADAIILDRKSVV